MTRDFFTDLERVLDDVLTRGMPRQGLCLPPLADASPAQRGAYDKLTALVEMINEAYGYATQISRGNLNATASRTNVFTMPLKALQADLSHLTWQANQVADGDLNHQVRFLGEFSRSFNRMIQSLRANQHLEHQLQLITDILDEGLLILDRDHRIIFANPEALKLTGYTREEIMAVPPFSALFSCRPDGRPFPPDAIPLATQLARGNSYTDPQGTLVQRSGELLPVMISGRPAPDGQAVIAFRDTTLQREHLKSLERLNRLLKHQAATDPLTGICNRMVFDQHLSRERHKAARSGRPFSLLLFDIDHFKQVNDIHGHAKGDQVLKALAKLVSRNIRTIDLFARWGGEEFVILPPDIHTDGALSLAEKLRAKIQAHDFGPDLTASFGVTTYQKGDTDTDLINRADAALYRAKHDGRNLVRFQD